MSLALPPTTRTFIIPKNKCKRNPNQINEEDHKRDSEINHTFSPLHFLYREEREQHHANLKMLYCIQSWVAVTRFYNVVCPKHKDLGHLKQNTNYICLQNRFIHYAWLIINVILTRSHHLYDTFISKQYAKRDAMQPCAQSSRSHTPQPLVKSNACTVKPFAPRHISAQYRNRIF